jgi:hypothetical protein
MARLLDPVLLTIEPFLAAPPFLEAAEDFFEVEDFFAPPFFAVEPAPAFLLAVLAADFFPPLSVRRSDAEEDTRELGLFAPPEDRFEPLLRPPPLSAAAAVSALTILLKLLRSPPAVSSW